MKKILKPSWFAVSKFIFFGYKQQNISQLQFGLYVPKPPQKPPHKASAGFPLPSRSHSSNNKPQPKPINRKNQEGLEETFELYINIKPSWFAYTWSHRPGLTT